MFNKDIRIVELKNKGRTFVKVKLLVWTVWLEHLLGLPVSSVWGHVAMAMTTRLRTAGLLLVYRCMYRPTADTLYRHWGWAYR